MSGSSRGNPSMADVVRSVAVLGVIVIAIYFVGRFFTVEPEHPTSEVDVMAVATGVEARTGFEPLVATGLPDDWRTTSVTVEDNGWQLGVLATDQDWIGFKQFTGTLDDVVYQVLGKNESLDEITIDGQTWQQFSELKGDDRAIARRFGDQTVVLHGTASENDLERYASALVPWSSVESD